MTSSSESPEGADPVGAAGSESPEGEELVGAAGSESSEGADPVESAPTERETTSRSAWRTRRWLRWTAYGAAALVVVVLLGAIIPVSSSNLDARPDPTDDHAAAVARFEQLTGEEEELGVFEPCRSRLLDHGERVAVSVVLFHGLTNCPEQFVEFGQELFDAGANVVVLRAPRHGLANGDGTAIGGVGKVGSLSAQELRDYADDSIDVAAGLGDEVRVLGLSMGGVLAMWTAQFRDDVQRVVAVAPAISIPGLPHFVTTAFVNLGNRLPNFSLPGSSKLDHAYAGESTGALSAMFLLARANENELTGRPAAADEVVVVLNPDDEQVDVGEVRQLVERWEDADGMVEIVDLPAVGLPHDVIDEDQPDDDVDLVYPLLVDLVGPI